MLTIAVVSVTCLLVLQAFDIIYFNEDGMQINVELFDSFKTSWYGWVFLILMQVLITTMLSFVPGVSMAFILLIQALFDYAWQAFLLAFIGVILTSAMMYIVGRFGGYKICSKLLGEEDCEKASQLLNDRGVVFFPLMMMFPIFPDDALTMIAGTLKMSLKWFVPSIVIGRGIGIATITFGLSVVPFDKFTTPWHWIIFVLLCAAGLLLVFYLASRLNNYLYKRNHRGDEVTVATDAAVAEAAEETIESCEPTELTGAAEEEVNSAEVMNF